MAMFDQESYNEYLRRLDIRKTMRRDVNNDFNRFRVFYQPIVMAPEFKVAGAEALLRWSNDKFGNVSPAVFIPILEESGLIIPVGRYVLKEAAQAFGTGYSNMRYLQEIEAKTVKIDRSFVMQALQNEHDYNIISHIIDMVHSLGSSVCMEGIEQSDELQKMMKMHPDMIQGYYFGKPSPEEQFESQFVQATGSP